MTAKQHISPVSIVHLQKADPKEWAGNSMPG